MKRPRQSIPDYAYQALEASDGRARCGARTTALLAIVVAGCTASEEPSPPSVLLDGLFDEWAQAATLIDDPPDAPDAAVDVLSVQAMDDERWLYLALDVGNEVSLQALPGTLHLLVDADADRGTGLVDTGMQGVDLVVDLAQATVPGIERRLGFGLRAAGQSGDFVAVGDHGLGLVAAPTWAAPRFELRLSRLGARDAPALGGSLRLKAVYEEDGVVLDETEVGTFAFASGAADEPPTAPPGGSEPRLAKPPGSVRVAAWNVSSGLFTRYTESFARVIGAIGPDVLLLDELPGTVTTDELDQFFASPPLATSDPWTYALGETGGRQRAAVAARGARLLPATSLSSVTYPEGYLDALRADADGGWYAELDREEARGISAVGAWVELGETPVLFTAVDLQATGWAGSPHDRLRVLQASRIRDLISAENADGSAPVVIGGDFNLVGSRAPLFAMVRRLDIDGSDLTPVDAQRLGERTLATWRAPGGSIPPFAPGRLDFLLVPDAAVTVVNSFVFATEDLDDATLERLGLGTDLMLGISDHLVVVADLLFASTPPPPTPPR